MQYGRIQAVNGAGIVSRRWTSGGWSQFAATEQWKIHAVVQRRPVVLRVLYDGECILCAHEIAMLKKRSPNSFDMVDISSPDFNSTAFGVEYEAAMQMIHVVLPNGDLVKGGDAFVLMYDEAGGMFKVLKTLLESLPEWMLEAAYATFAKHRLALTGRPSLPELLARRAAARSWDSNRAFGSCRQDVGICSTK